MKRKNIVCSHNEWDRLEEVIVGSVKGASKPEYEPFMQGYFDKNSNERSFKGGLYTEKEIEEAEEQLDKLANLLKKEGITVRRPDFMNFSKEIQTPDFSVKHSNCCACPRDVILIIGDEIIEAPMAQRTRFFEYHVYRNLIKEYFKSGARWTAAPKPFMGDETYTKDFSLCDGKKFEVEKYTLLTDFEPCFDAASFMRFGKDIWYQIDFVTNEFGVEWLKRHLGDKYRFHRVAFNENHPHHIDASLVPLTEGIVMMNPDRPSSNNVEEIFKKNGWEIVLAPETVRSVDSYCPTVSKWINMNIISIDRKKIVVDEDEIPMIKMLEKLGFTVLTTPFDKVYKFGGGFHCCTSDIRRAESFKSYFPLFD